MKLVLQTGHFGLLMLERDKMKLNTLKQINSDN